MSKRATPRRFADSEAAATLSKLRVSPRKLNLVASSIRGMAAGEALQGLAFNTRRVSNDVGQLLRSVIANAENNHQLDVDRLYVAEAFVGKSLVMKRWRPRARGRRGRILKPLSNITIVVREREEG